MLPSLGRPPRPAASTTGTTSIASGPLTLPPAPGVVARTHSRQCSPGRRIVRSRRGCSRGSQKSATPPPALDNDGVVWGVADHLPSDAELLAAVNADERRERAQSARLVRSSQSGSRAHSRQQRSADGASASSRQSSSRVPTAQRAKGALRNSVLSAKSSRHSSSRGGTARGGSASLDSPHTSSHFVRLSSPLRVSTPHTPLLSAGFAGVPPKDGRCVGGAVDWGWSTQEAPVNDNDGSREPGGIVETDEREGDTSLFLAPETAHAENSLWDAAIASSSLDGIPAAGQPEAISATDNSTGVHWGTVSSVEPPRLVPIVGINSSGINLGVNLSELLHRADKVRQQSCALALLRAIWLRLAVLMNANGICGNDAADLDAILSTGNEMELLRWVPPSLFYLDERLSEPEAVVDLSGWPAGDRDVRMLLQDLHDKQAAAAFSKRNNVRHPLCSRRAKLARRFVPPPPHPLLVLALDDCADVTDEALVSIARSPGCRWLRNISICKCNNTLLTSYGIVQVLHCCSSLRVFRGSGCVNAATDDVLLAAAFATCGTLRNHRSGAVADATAAREAELARGKLHTLVLSHCSRFTNGGLAAFLDHIGSRVRAVNVMNEKAVAALTSLDLSHCDGIDDMGFVLNDDSEEVCKVGPAANITRKRRAWQVLSNVRTLNLGSLRIGAGGAGGLSWVSEVASKTLTHLDFSGAVGVNDATLMALGGVQDGECMKTNVQLVSLPKLRWLSLYGCHRITSLGLWCLLAGRDDPERTKSFAHIDGEGGSVVDADIHAVDRATANMLEALHRRPALTHLDVRGCVGLSPTARAAHCSTRAIASSCPKLRRLHAAGALTRASAVTVAALVQGCHELTHVDLSTSSVFAAVGGAVQTRFDALSVQEIGRELGASLVQLRLDGSVLDNTSLELLARGISNAGRRLDENRNRRKKQREAAIQARKQAEAEAKAAARKREIARAEAAAKRRAERRAKRKRNRIVDSSDDEISSSSEDDSDDASEDNDAERAAVVRVPPAIDDDFAQGAPLRVFSLRNNIAIGDVGIQALALACPNLEELFLSGCTLIGDAAIVTVAAHCLRLEVVDLRNCDRIGDVALHALAANCPQLRRLAAGGEGKCVDGVTSDGSGIRISDASLQALARNCQDLESLHLSHCVNLTYEGLGALASPVDVKGYRDRVRARTQFAVWSWAAAAAEKRSHCADYEDGSEGSNKTDGIDALAACNNPRVACGALRSLQLPGGNTSAGGAAAPASVVAVASVLPAAQLNTSCLIGAGPAVHTCAVQRVVGDNLWRLSAYVGRREVTLQAATVLVSIIRMFLARTRYLAELARLEAAKREAAAIILQRTARGFAIFKKWHHVITRLMQTKFYAVRLEERRHRSANKIRRCFQSYRFRRALRVAMMQQVRLRVTRKLRSRTAAAELQRWWRGTHARRTQISAWRARRLAHSNLAQRLARGYLARSQTKPMLAAVRAFDFAVRNMQRRRRLLVKAREIREAQRHAQRKAHAASVVQRSWICWRARRQRYAQWLREAAAAPAIAAMLIEFEARGHDARIAKKMLPRRRRAVRDHIWPWWLSLRDCVRQWHAQQETEAARREMANRRREELERRRREGRAGHAATQIQAWARGVAARQLHREKKRAEVNSKIAAVHQLPAVRRRAANSIEQWYLLEKLRYRRKIWVAIMMQARWRGRALRKWKEAWAEYERSFYHPYAICIQARWRGYLQRLVRFREVRRRAVEDRAAEKHIKLKRMRIREEHLRAAGRKGLERYAAKVIQRAARIYIAKQARTTFVNEWAPAHNRKPTHRMFDDIKNWARDRRVRSKERAAYRARVKEAKQQAKREGVKFVLSNHPELEFDPEELAAARFSVINTQNITMNQSGVTDLWLTVGSQQMYDFGEKQKIRRNQGVHVFERIGIDLRDNVPRNRTKQWTVNKFNFSGSSGDEQAPPDQIYLWASYGQGDRVLTDIKFGERSIGSFVAHQKRMRECAENGQMVRSQKQETGGDGVTCLLEMYLSNRMQRPGNAPIKNVAVTKGDDLVAEKNLRELMYKPLEPDLGKLGLDPGTRVWVQQPDPEQPRALHRTSGELQGALGKLFSERVMWVIDHTGMGTDDVLEVKRIFDEIDRTGLGEVDYTEVLAWLGETPASWMIELFKLVNDTGPGGPGKHFAGAGKSSPGAQLSFDRFLHVMCAISLMEQEQALRFIFHLADDRSAGCINRKQFIRAMSALARANPLIAEHTALKAADEFNDPQVQNANGQMMYPKFKEIIERFPALCSAVFLLITRVTHRFLGVPFWEKKKRLMAEARRQLQMVENNVKQYRVQDLHGDFQEQGGAAAESGPHWQQQAFLYDDTGDVRKREVEAAKRRAKRKAAARAERHRANETQHAAAKLSQTQSLAALDDDQVLHSSSDDEDEVMLDQDEADDVRRKGGPEKRAMITAFIKQHTGGYGAYQTKQEITDIKTAEREQLRADRIARRHQERAKAAAKFRR